MIPAADVDRGRDFRFPDFRFPDFRGRDQADSGTAGRTT